MQSIGGKVTVRFYSLSIQRAMLAAPTLLPNLKFQFYSVPGMLTDVLFCLEKAKHENVHDVHGYQNVSDV